MGRVPYAKRIAELNDQLRARGGITCATGKTVLTRGIAALDPVTIAGIWSNVVIFDDFDGDNDPHGEHDYGSFEVVDVGKVIWKIDYYADDQCDLGSENPSDPDSCFRVMTVMLAEEY